MRQAEPSAPFAGGLPPLIQALQRPAPYPHRVGRVRLVQTHISWVLLTGAFAYKIKKPVDLGFLDFSTLARRRQACEEELRLNRRWAPDLYLDVVAVMGTPAAPRLGGDGAPFEYAVRMRQFPQSGQLDRRLAAGALTTDEIEDFARRLTGVHAAAPVAPDGGPFGTAAAVRAPVEDTVAVLLARARDSAEAASLETIRRWTASQPGDEGLQARLRDGFVREVHGDLHLANLVRWRGQVHAFDCIEFDPALRWIDVLSDVAFLMMDLAYRGRRDLAYAFLNRYLEVTGDYAGVRVLRYYRVYRALVRAKIAAIRRATRSAGVANGNGASVRAHLALAQAWTQPPSPALVLMHGFSGSGKTRLGDALATGLPAVRLRSDLERRRQSATAGRYGAAGRDATYARLLELAEAVLAGGENAVIDATFLSRGQRERFAALAARLGVPRLIVDCVAPRRVLERRIVRRARAGADASEADLAVLAGQIESAEPLTPAERAGALELDTSRPVDATALARVVRSRVAQPRRRRFPPRFRRRLAGRGPSAPNRPAAT